MPQTQDFLEFTHGEFRFAQGAEDAEAGFVAQELEDPGQLFDLEDFRHAT